MNTYIKERRDEGFTLIELLIAIVVVGILTAVVIVGIGGLTDTGKKSACQASRDAAKAAAAVHYNNQRRTRTRPTFSRRWAPRRRSSTSATASPRRRHDQARQRTGRCTMTTGGGATADVTPAPRSQLTLLGSRGAIAPRDRDGSSIDACDAPRRGDSLIEIIFAIVVIGVVTSARSSPRSSRPRTARPRTASSSRPTPCCATTPRP